VRDVLYIGDLARAFESAVERIDRVRGEIYNIGGGPDFTLSIWAEVKPLLESLAGRKVEVRNGDWRPGDQKVYISDIRKAEAELGWKPKKSPQDGVRRLWEWVSANAGLFE